MKLEVSRTKVVFKPVTLSITFESEEELRLFHEMTNSNYSIPELLEKYGYVTKVESNILNRMLLDISEELDKLKD